MKRAMTPTAIVAGGAGFIGSHLCERLLKNHVEVVCVDNLSTGKKSNLVNCLSSREFHFLTVSAQALSLDRILRAHYVFHIIDTEEHSQTDNLDTLMASVTATKRLLDVTVKFRAKFLLASTIDIYTDFISATSLAHYSGPPQTSAHHSLIESKRLAESLTAEYFNLQNIDARVVRLTDTYGPRQDLSSPHPISRLLRSAHQGQSLQVTADGFRRLYPIYVLDTVEGIMAAMFSPQTSGQIFTLTPAAPITELDLAHTLSRLVPTHPQVRLHGISGESASPAVAPPQRSEGWNWHPATSLEAGLTLTLSWLDDLGSPEAPIPHRRLQPLRQSLPQPLPPSSHRFRLTRPWQVLIASVVFIFMLISPFLSLAFITSLALKDLTRLPSVVSSGNLDQALRLSRSASSRFTIAEKQLNFIGSLTSPLGLGNQVYRLEKLLELGSDLSQASQHLFASTQHLIAGTRLILGQTEGDPSIPIQAAQAESTRAYELLSLAASHKIDITTGAIGQYYKKLELVLPSLQSQTETLRNLLTALPEIIGLPHDKKSYLVLLQNNAELRPTGGFIGSFALLTFQNGRLLDFQIEDVYTADGQLKGFVAPPNPIKKYLGEASWYLRDVNWDPDFPTTARQAEWFLQKELNREVDGTLAINLYVAQKLLQTTGPLELSDYQETITADNLFERAEYHSEIDFFPGSTQKKDFLGALSRALYSQLQTADSSLLLKLAPALNQSLLENQLLISLNHPAAASTFADNHWDGQLHSPSCSPEPCFSDYWNLVEANVGVNKANFFVRRKLNHQINIAKENYLTATTTITYTNTSAADSWPAGTYKNYLRLYTPKGSELIKVTIDDQPVRAGSIDTTLEHSKTIFGFLVQVPIKTTATVTITYRLPGKLSFPSESPLASYAGLFQKQSGTGADPFTIEVVFPSYMKPITYPDGSVISPQTLIFSTNTSQDISFPLQLVK